MSSPDEAPDSSAVLPIPISDAMLPDILLSTILLTSEELLLLKAEPPVPIFSLPKLFGAAAPCELEEDGASPPSLPPSFLSLSTEATLLTPNPTAAPPPNNAALLTPPVKRLLADDAA